MPDPSFSFVGRLYIRGGQHLQIGDQVRVYPSTEKHSEPYNATVVEHKGKVCLDVPGGTFKAPITEKLFSRLEKI
jgi:hypothetical protein